MTFDAASSGYGKVSEAEVVEVTPESVSLIQRFRGPFLVMLLLLVLVATGHTPQVQADLGANQYLLLTTDATDYTIENEYYKALIPKPAPGVASGIIKHLYIKKADGNWSQDLVYQGYAYYALGYLEGTGSASSGTNNSTGMQQSSSTAVDIIENTPTRIKIRSTLTNANASFSETWTFWAKKSYFQSEASVSQISTVLTNQFQFAWMVNSALPITWYGTDMNGAIETYPSRTIQQIHSPNMNTYPWLNWQFTGEPVSLGMVFTDINSRYSTVGETGDMPFEYQLDFQLGSGSLGSPLRTGYERTAQVIYYTANSASNTPIQNFANNTYQNASTTATTEPILQASATATDAYGQNLGASSALLNSPYFLVRQNAQNRHTGIEWSQYATSIFAPLYKYQTVIHSGSYDFKDQVQYSLNYDNDATTFAYGTISSATASGSSSLEHIAASSDGKVNYDTFFQAWADSDKLQITGTSSNGSASAPIKDIYMSLVPAYSYTYEAETATPAASITGVLNNNDNLWTDYTLYGFDSGDTLIYRDNGENVPPLDIAVSQPAGTYDVKAYVNQRIEGAITYKYSTDGVSYSSFVVPIGGANGSYTVDLGVLTLNGNFYINDDDLGTGIAGYGGWDKIVVTPAFTSLGSNVYDLQLQDSLYTTVGVAAKINSPTDNIVNLGTELRIYLYKQNSQQTLGTFSYPFDVDIYPHTGALATANDFTGLHSQNVISYQKHNFYAPQNIHTGRTNSVFADGSITYSTDPYNNTTEVGLTAVPSTGSLDVNIITWLTSGTYDRKWTEFSATTNATTTHTVTGLKANMNYIITVDSNLYTSATSDAVGKINFTYSGGYSTRTFEVIEDSTPPTGPSVFSPTSYTTTGQPVLTFGKGSDSNGIASYTVTLDSGKLKSYSLAGIPATGNGTADYVWLDNSTVKVEFLNENDADATNDMIRVTFKELSTSPLTEGAHTWQVTTYDQAGNSTVSSTNLLIDQTAPVLSGLEITGTGTVTSGNTYLLSSPDLILTGNSVDSYVGSSKGSDSFDKVASGPTAVTVTVDKLVSGDLGSSQAVYTNYLSQSVAVSGVVDVAGLSKTGSFSLTASKALTSGDYRISVSAKDGANNSSTTPDFYVTLAATSTGTPTVPTNPAPSPAPESPTPTSGTTTTTPKATSPSERTSTTSPNTSTSTPETNNKSTKPAPTLNEVTPTQQSDPVTIAIVVLLLVAVSGGTLMLLWKFRDKQ